MSVNLRERSAIEDVLSAYVTGAATFKSLEGFHHAMSQTTLTGKLTADFFRRAPAVVARQLLGMELVRTFDEGREVRGRIQEVAAYEGEVDRTSPGMYDAPGMISVSMKHGRCLIDIATDSYGVPSCVTLIGAVFEWEGTRQLVSGPGNLSKALGIDRSYDGMPIEGRDFYIEPNSSQVKAIRERQRSGTPKNFIGSYYARMDDLYR